MSNNKPPTLKFIDGMNMTMVGLIDSIIDYDFGEGKSGHILWLTIDDRNYYCVQPEGQSLSEEVMK